MDVISEIKKKISELGGGKIIFLTISGSHLYGFESGDSDIDYRGTFITSTNNLLGLKSASDVIEMERDGNDIVLFEVKKEIVLALSGNCNVLEHINSKPIVNTAEFIKLRQLVNNAFGKNGLYNSYKGMAASNYKKFVLQGRNTIKKYLYVFRGLMAGIHVLQTGEIEPNIEELNKYFKFPEVKQLIGMKKEGKENDTPPKELDTGRLEERINYLFGKIDEAYLKSKIPDQPDEKDVKALNEFLKKIRKGMLRQN